MFVEFCDVKQNLLSIPIVLQLNINTKGILMNKLYRNCLILNRQTTNLQTWHI